jgi:hypothetical protein
MRHRTLLASAIATLFALHVHAATDPAAVLRGNLAASGGDHWNGKAVLRLEAAIAGQGLTGTDISVEDLVDGRSVDHAVIGPATQASGYDGHEAWEQDSSGAVNIMSGGDAVPLAINNAYRDANLWWRPDFGGAQVAAGAPKTEGGTHYDVLTITPKGGLPFEAWFDAATHLLARTIEKQGSSLVTTSFSDYREVDGVKVAFRNVVDSGHGEQYLQTVTITRAAFEPAHEAATYAPPKVTVTDFSLPAGATQTSFPFQLRNNHIYADVAVNGRGPMLFIFDTGGHDILEHATARALGIKVEGSMPGVGVGDKAQDFGLAKVDTLKVGDAVFTQQVFGALDFIPHEVEGMPIQGMVGFEVFKRFVTRIDYGSHVMTLIEPKSFDPADAGTPVKFVFDGELPQVEGTFEGIPGKFNIDTGARDEITLTSPFVQANGLRAKHPVGVEAVDGWGVGGPARAYVTRGAQLTLGAVEVPQVVTALSTQSKGAFASASYSGNVGGGLLKRFVVTFDYSHQVMYLKPLPQPVADVGGFDRAGMWINGAPDGFQVMDVSAAGAAQAAGLQAGDIITAVDGRPAASIPIYELRARLRNEAPGTQVALEVRRGSDKRSVRIALRDQI